MPGKLSTKLKREAEILRQAIGAVVTELRDGTCFGHERAHTTHTKRR